MNADAQELILNMNRCAEDMERIHAETARSLLGMKVVMNEHLSPNEIVITCGPEMYMRVKNMALNEIDTGDKEDD